MRLAPLALALSFLAPHLVAASPAAAEQPSGLAVSGFFWGRTEKTIVHPVYGTMSEQNWLRLRRDPRYRRRPGAPPPTILLQRETYVLVRNLGSKTVKGVTWTYVFYSNEKHEKELRRFSFHSKETLKAGEMKFLTQYVGEPAPSAFGAVTIDRVEYDDGSTWQRTTAGA